MFGDPWAFLVSTLFLLPGIAIGVPVHELAHGYAALWQGDTSVRNRGCLSLNEPRRFFTLYGTLALLFWRVGWGERVPVNENRLRGPGGIVLYSLAGPAANLLVAVVAGIGVRLLAQQGAFPSPTSTAQPPLELVSTVVYVIFFVNLSMFAFNLLPIPGLDGWRVVETLFRRRNPRFFFDVDVRKLQITQVMIIILVVASFVPGINLLNVVMLPFYMPTSTLILGVCLGYPGLSPCPALGHF